MTINQSVGPHYDLSGAFYYKEGEIEIVQPMRIVDTYPKDI